MNSRGSSTVGLIARREITTRLRAKSLYVVTGLLVVGIIALGVVARLTGDDSAETWQVGTIADTDGIVGDAVGDLAHSIGAEVTITPLAGDDAGDRLEAGDVDVVLDVADRQLLFDETVDDRIAGVVQQVWTITETRRGLAAAGLTDAQVDDAFEVAPLDVSTVGGDDETDPVAVIAGMLAAILLFISLQTFGTYVLTGVVEEKSSAVVEVLLVRTRPSQLLAGKVIGIGSVALGQFLAAVCAGLLALSISGTAVPGAVWSAVPTTVVWFLGGFVMYSTLFALAGSLVSRQEDAQAAAVPVTTLLIGAYMLIYILGFVPESTASTVLSMVPFVAPLLMPMRMAAGAASGIEVAISFGLVVVTTWLIWQVASRIYEQVLLRRGSRIAWRDAAALLRVRQ